MVYALHEGGSYIYIVMKYCVNTSRMISPKSPVHICNFLLINLRLWLNISVYQSLNQVLNTIDAEYL